MLSSEVLLSRRPWRRALLLGLIAAVCASLMSCAPRTRERADSAAPKLGVNAFLWQASLETLAFAPLVSTDPVGGVIASGWYSSRTEPNERFRLTVFIQGKSLRADGVRVNVLRQARAEAADAWQNASSSKEARIKIENAILTRARELRIAALARQ